LIPEKIGLYRIPERYFGQSCGKIDAQRTPSLTSFGRAARQWFIPGEPEN